MFVNRPESVPIERLSKIEYFEKKIKVSNTCRDRLGLN